MGDETGISWCDATFNCWIGCTKVSPACDNCYAERDNGRFHWVSGWGPGEPRKRTSVANWRKPYQWNEAACAAGKPLKVFCASLADVYDNEVPEEWRLDLWRVMHDTPWLRWILLTKRIGNVAKMRPGPWPANAGLMISVCNQDEANRDIPKLLAAKAELSIPWVGISAEPLLGAIDLYEVAGLRWSIIDRKWNPRSGVRLDWVITGGESGPGARPSHPDWFRMMRDHCKGSGVPFHFKQWGEFVSVSEVAGHGEHHTFPDGATVRRVGKFSAGHRLDGVEHREFPLALFT